MAKYKTGEYQIIYFDKYGTKQETDTEINFTNSVEKAKLYIREHPDRSSVVGRILYNSIDDKGKQ